MELQHVEAPRLWLVGHPLLFGQGVGTDETLRALVNLPFDDGHGLDRALRLQVDLLDGDGDALAVPFRAPAGPDLQTVAEPHDLRENAGLVEGGWLWYLLCVQSLHSLPPRSVTAAGASFFSSYP